MGKDTEWVTRPNPAGGEGHTLGTVLELEKGQGHLQRLCIHEASKAKTHLKQDPGKSLPNRLSLENC